MGGRERDVEEYVWISGLEEVEKNFGWVVDYV